MSLRSVGVMMIIIFMMTMTNTIRCIPDYGEAPPRPPSSRDAPPPPRPPPPETDDEFENSFPTPQHNQPIMVSGRR